MNSAREVLEQLVDEGRFPNADETWLAFATWLENHKGAELYLTVKEQATISKLRTEIACDNLDGDWMREFSHRKDVVEAAEKFAAHKRSGSTQ